MAKKMVLIESDWNLKEAEDRQWSARRKVLIESDWNLKIASENAGKKLNEY